MTLAVTPEARPCTVTFPFSQDPTNPERRLALQMTLSDRSKALLGTAFVESNRPLENPFHPLMAPIAIRP